MARVLAPAVHYTDVQWRALKAKARNNDPSLTPKDIEIISEVIRVYDAIVKGNDPTPRSHLANSIRMDERQVVKFFLWGTIEKYGSTFTLIRTFFLPKRRPVKGQKPAEEVMRPRRDSTGNTNGFVRPVKKIAEAVEKNVASADESNEENGVEKMSIDVNEDVGHGATANGSPTGKKRSRRPKADANNTFVRRSSRRVGGSLEKIDGVELKEVLSEVEEKEGSSSLGGSNLGDKVAVDTPAADSTHNAGSTSSPVEQRIGTGDNGEVRDRAGSNGLSNSISGHQMTSSPPDTNNTPANSTNNVPTPPLMSFFPPSTPSANTTSNVRPPPPRPRIRLLLSPRTPSASNINNHAARQPPLNSPLPPSTTPANNPTNRLSSLPTFLPPSTPPNNTTNDLPSAPSSSPPPNAFWNQANNTYQLPLPTFLLPQAPRLSPSLPPVIPPASSTEGPSLPAPLPSGISPAVETNSAHLAPYQAHLPSNASAPHRGDDKAGNTPAASFANHTFPPPPNTLYPSTVPYTSPYGPISAAPNDLAPNRRASNSSTISAPDTDTHTDEFLPAKREEPRRAGGSRDMQEKTSMSQTRPSADENETMPHTDPSEPFEEPLDLLQMANNTPKIGDRVSVSVASEASSPVRRTLSSAAEEMEMEMDWEV
ncbi:hypothetical protein DSL72_004913 [Monilinia vaccinii-corymbosi]|uniref:Uncharacterized protein n=1 Tax=Monilinia vaccinii-corymbosi TaxID=61207 RepID=A0A8A3P1Q5_9HELO|nr:hypothetical protein DSL72_004913 [Monilinia vaccinii-corymbosi]